tara:strand:- start:2922 stop:4199 length:1278 start_codon:yes stop_codon:yes gene_type:complete
VKWNVKLKAGALQFVLFIGVVIAILLLTFVTLSHTHSFFSKKTGLLIQTIKKADLGLAFAMKSDMILNDTVTIDLGMADDPIAIKAVKTYWGVFEKYAIVSSFKKTRFVKNALIGGEFDQLTPALYVKDMDRPMIIAGHAKITGDAFLPKQGIRTGNISGHSYFLKELVYGKQKVSKSELPELDQKLKQQLTTVLLEQSYGSNDAISIQNNSALRVSFNQPTQFIYGTVITMADQELTGHIVVQASQKIIIEASALLQDIVLLAPEIIIKDGVTGTFQAIASHFISVGKGCQLTYPSALVVYENFKNPSSPNNQQKPNILIQEKASITGVVVYLGKTKEQFFYPQLKIEAGARITGEVYCEEGLELKGEVRGTVATARFMALENGSIYQNHLYNGTINSSLVPEHYVGILLDESIRKKEIAKWLY